ncbi:MAG: GDSL-type esterase/lipase family protein [Flammeovirgaceae bacterium]
MRYTVIQLNYYLATLFVVITLSIAQGQSAEDTMLVDDYGEDLFSQYPFLDETRNELIMTGNTGLNGFFSKLQSLEGSQSSKVHIMHIGDSHIQADFFSGKVRTLFKEDIRFPMHERGFVFPYRLAKTNNPLNYQVRYTGQWEGKKCVSSKHYSQWGVSGISAVTTSSTSSFTINPNRTENDYDIKKLKVFYPVADSSSFQAKVLLDSGNQLINYIVADGYMEFEFLKPQQAITITLAKKSPKQQQFILQGIWLESENPSVTYSATGVNGAEVPSYFRCQDFNKQLAQLNPDLIVISLGTNDAFKAQFDAAQFRADYRKLIANIRKYLPEVDILLTTAGDSYRRRRPNKYMEVAADEVIALAKEMHVVVWDFYRVMGGLKSIKEWREQGLCAKDLLHFSQKGYEIQGELFFQALDVAYEEYCNGAGK